MTYKINIVGFIKLAITTHAAIAAVSVVVRVMAVKILAADTAVHTAGQMPLGKQLLVFEVGRVLVFAVLLALAVPGQVVTVAKVAAVSNLLLLMTLLRGGRPWAPPVRRVACGGARRIAGQALSYSLLFIYLFSLPTYYSSMRFSISKKCRSWPITYLESVSIFADTRSRFEAIPASQLVSFTKFAPTVNICASCHWPTSAIVRDQLQMVGAEHIAGMVSPVVPAPLPVPAQPLIGTRKSPFATRCAVFIALGGETL